MDGVHDMGGMQGFGPVVRDELVFHDDWERRTFGMLMSVPIERTNTDEFRHSMERLDPAFYLASSYYGRWLAALEVRLDERGTVTSDEIDEQVGSACRPVANATIGLPHESPDGGPQRTLDHPARFAVGDRVRTLDVHPHGHTRLPRYARGKVGTVAVVHPAFTFPDTVAHGLGDDAQYVYAVGFRARDLWNEGDHVVHVDVWERYLEPA